MNCLAQLRLRVDELRSLCTLNGVVWRDAKTGVGHLLTTAKSWKGDVRAMWV